jgi:hypothetical protein
MTLTAWLFWVDSNGRCRDLLPGFMRTWPWFRRFYWSEAEIKAIRESSEFAEFFARDEETKP